MVASQVVLLAFVIVFDHQEIPLSGAGQRYSIRRYTGIVTPVGN